MGMVWALALATYMLFPVTPSFRESTAISEKLPNGAKLFAIVRADLPYSVVSLWLKKGSNSDPKGKEGTAHLLEHLLPLKPLNGTTVQIAMERKGILLTPETGRDFMAFHLQSLTEEVAKALSMLVEATSDLEVDLKVLEREKRLMYLETLALYEDPLWLMKTALEAKIFEGTTYAHPPTGWLETISRLSAEDVQRFHQTNFTAPNFAVIAIVREDATLKAVKEAMINLPSNPLSTSVSASLPVGSDSPPHFEPLLKSALNHPREVFFGIGWKLEVSAEEKAEADALLFYLRRTSIPLLFGKLGIVKEWRMTANFVRGSLALTVTARVRPYTELVEQGLKRVLNELAQRELTDAELSSLKRVLLWERMRNLNNPIRLCRELGMAWAIYDDQVSVSGYVEAVCKLNARRIRELASRLASTQPLIAVVRK